MDEIDTTNELIVGTSAVTGPPTTSSNPNYKVGLDGGHRLNALRMKSEDAYVNLGNISCCALSSNNNNTRKLILTYHDIDFSF